DNGVMISVSELNEARREAADGLENEILKREERRSFPYAKKAAKVWEKPPILTAEVSNFEQAKACIEAGISEIYLPNAIFGEVKKAFPNIMAIVKMPPVMRDDRNYKKTAADKILISNIGKIDGIKECFGDYRLNITNSDSISVFDNLVRVTLSPELNIAELSEIAEGCEILAYGRLSLMLMENCILRAFGKCQNGNFSEMLTDRMGEKFPLKCNEGCVLELLNSKPLYMADKIADLVKLKPSALRLIFTVENFAECGKIIEEYRTALSGKAVKTPHQNTFTRGHFYRGVE
ncbi:MAG: U32 family peptidase, partial [Clostridia bacterium]|nr:U32 family peptidase [Clostridia bacterium]